MRIKGALAKIADMDTAVLTEIVNAIEGHQEEINRLCQDLAQEQAVNAANTETLRILKAAVCKAAFFLALPGSDCPAATGWASGSRRHFHQLLMDDAYEALTELAALDDSAYALAFGALEGATGP